MSRNINNAFITSSVDLVQPYFAAYLDFSGSAVRVWTGNANKALSDDFGGGTYLGVGTFGGISSVTETTEISARGLELTLSGIPSEYVSLALTDNYRGREMALYCVLFNTAMTATSSFTVFRGRMDQLIITDTGESSTIMVKCESRLIELNRADDVRYTEEAQKLLYPGDTGLQYVSSLADKSIYWGNSGPGSTGNNGDGADGGDNDGSTSTSAA